MSSLRRPALKPPALRSQVGVALVALAVVSVALAGASVRGASDRELGEFGRRDLQQTADRLAVSAGFAYTAANGFLPRRLRELLVAERAEGHAVAVLDVRRRPVRSSATRIPREHR